ncbi:unnamed protein product [Fraxinus pennsylvanica]|uniref:TF-B3 domain-containing protein n=1 Tax=Fraxinus pennsylvanica TaxID=56036 RepID=A0AAD2AFP4_9LAMI|nr:unnamed protein product [Fraxinus pennsylvanica]
MEFEGGESQADDSEPEEVSLRRSAHNAKGKQPVYTRTRNPRFRVTLKEHHRYRLPLNKEFVTEAKLAYKKAVVLKKGSRCWPVALHHPKTGQFKLTMSTGWSEFREANGLAFGGKRLFEFIPSKNVISVGVIMNEIS